ncbi:hypothetical protein CB1_000133004 [Camelus ferus]|nr:hypothetical protein CB1_000133004 [Camelus ferus]
MAWLRLRVTETRTGPLGCSNYDNLDSVSSVLVQSPENKIQLQGLQVLLPDYLQERFVQAALSYIACNSEGEFICKDNDCWCHCGPKFPECNCPSMDIQAMEENLLRITETWKAYNIDFEESGIDMAVLSPGTWAASVAYLSQDLFTPDLVLSCGAELAELRHPYSCLGLDHPRVSA